jgi:hypothetical protein
VNAQPHTLHEPKPAAVKQSCHQPLHSMQMREKLAHFVACKHNWQARRPLCTLDVAQPTDLLLGHLFVKKKQRAERLILRWSSDMDIACQMRQEFGQLLLRHLGGMAFVVEENEAPNPIYIHLLCPDAEMLSSDYISDLIQQFRFLPWRRSR